MRKVLWISLMSAAIATTGACKKREDKNYDQASKAVEKSKEDVDKQQKDVTKDQQDVAKQQGELNAAKNELDRARTDYVNATRSRIAAIDAKLDELRAKTTDKARTAYAGLKDRRDLIANRLHDIEARSADISKDFRKDFDDSMTKLEK